MIFGTAGKEKFANMQGQSTKVLQMDSDSYKYTANSTAKLYQVRVSARQV